MKIPHKIIATVFLVSLGQTSTFAANEPQYQKLKLKNDFKSPEEVVRYYCDRDASGFVWSGLLESERKEFTVWRSVPNHDSFFIAKRFEVVPQGTPNPTTENATVEVRYELAAIGDAFGTRVPSPVKDMKVTFNLKKVDGAWKIAQPEPDKLAPVVLESKFVPAAASTD